MNKVSSEEIILDLYARYRSTGWRFRRLTWQDGRWGIGFVCAGSMVQIQIVDGIVRGLCYNLDGCGNTMIGIDAPALPKSYDTLYRRLDKKAGVTRGK